ncbi:hypothetical protein [Phycicoccus avicenniae]|uniref:hypothetical protein n=1 Tax=Phycicoccus avicenniae TaxID=2828860 RepID=UPI003D2B4863
MHRRTTVHTIRTTALLGVSALLAAALTAPPGASGAPPTLAPAAAATVAAARADTTAPRHVRLITGDVVTLPSAGHPAPGLVRAPGSRATYGIARMPGHLYVVPSSVGSALSRLDLSLFDAQTLATRPADTPVTVTYASATSPTAVPGVEIRSRTGLVGKGVVTAKSSAALAKALRTRPASSVLAGVRGITAATPVVTPTFPMHTVTVRLLDTKGAPVDGLAILVNVDDMRRASVGVPVVAGEGRASLPAGNYQAAAFTFGDVAALPIVPEVSVTGPRSLTIDARTATTRPRVLLPQPTEEDITSIDVARTDARGTGSAVIGMAGGGGVPLFVTPVDAAAVRHGRIDSSLISVHDQPSPTPSYQYFLGYDFVGSVPRVMRFAPKTSDLEQVSMRYRGSTARSGRQALVENGIMTRSSGIGVGFSRTVPSRMTLWYGGSPGVSTLGSYVASYDWETDTGSEYLRGASRPVTPGASRSEEWNRRPSHPSFITPTAVDPYCGACIQGGQLLLTVPSFSDNDERHWGLVDDPARVAWTVASGGTQLGAGDGPLVGIFDLPTGTAPVVVTHRERMRRLGFPDSTTSTTWSTPRGALGQTVAAEACPDGTSTCRSLGMLETRYDLPVSDTGTLPAGTVAGRVSIRPFLSGANVTSVAVDVRYGSGAWTSVPVTPTGPTTFALRLPVPPGGGVATLRVRASDSARSSVTQTIAGAWTVAP